MGRDFYCGPISKETAAPVLALASAPKLVWTPQKWRPNSAQVALVPVEIFQISKGKIANFFENAVKFLPKLF